MSYLEPSQSDAQLIPQQQQPQEREHQQQQPHQQQHLRYQQQQQRRLQQQQDRQQIHQRQQEQSNQTLYQLQQQPHHEQQQPHQEQQYHHHQHQIQAQMDQLSLEQDRAKIAQDRAEVAQDKVLIEKDRFEIEKVKFLMERERLDIKNHQNNLEKERNEIIKFRKEQEDEICYQKNELFNFKQQIEFIMRSQMVGTNTMGPFVDERSHYHHHHHRNDGLDYTNADFFLSTTPTNTTTTTAIVSHPASSHPISAAAATTMTTPTHPFTSFLPLTPNINTQIHPDTLSNINTTTAISPHHHISTPTTTPTATTDQLTFQQVHQYISSQIESVLIDISLRRDHLKSTAEQIEKYREYLLRRELKLKKKEEQWQSEFEKEKNKLQIEKNIIETRRQYIINESNRLGLDFFLNNTDNNNNNNNIDIISLYLKYPRERFELIQKLNLNNENAKFLLEMNDEKLNSIRIQNGLKIYQNFANNDNAFFQTLLLQSDDEFYSSDYYRQFKLSSRREYFQSILTQLNQNSQYYGSKDIKIQIEIFSPQLRRYICWGAQHYAKFIDCLYIPTLTTVSSSNSQSSTTPFSSAYVIHTNPYAQLMTCQDYTLFQGSWYPEYLAEKIPKLPLPSSSPSLSSSLPLSPSHQQPIATVSDSDSDNDSDSNSDSDSDSDNNSDSDDTKDKRGQFFWKKSKTNNQTPSPVDKPKKKTNVLSKLFFSTPTIASGDWIQFYGPGCELLALDPNLIIYAGSFCPPVVSDQQRASQTVFTNMSTYIMDPANAMKNTNHTWGQTRTSAPYQVSIKWEVE